MEFRGKLSGVTKDLVSNKFIISFQADHVAGLEDIQDKDLDIEAKVHREKRSLDANKYAWVLMSKLADKYGLDKWDIYLASLIQHSNSFEVITLSTDAIKRFSEAWRTVVDLGEVREGWHQLQVYYGSSTFNTKEMSTFIDGIVQECKDAGIETMTPDELLRLKQGWGEINGEKT